MTSPRWEGARGWSFLLWLSAVVSVVPLFLTRYVPFTDLPEHVATIASLRHWWDPAWRVQEHYTLLWSESQYLPYHLSGAALAFITGSADWANRLLLAGIGVALPFSLRSLLDALDRDRRLVLFACPLFWNRPLVVGFLPYVASIPLLLCVLAQVTRQARAPTKLRGTGIAAAFVLSFYLHVSTYILGIVIAAAILLGITKGARQLAWLLPSAACGLLWFVRGRMTLHADSLADAGEISKIGFVSSVRAFPLWAHDIWRSHLDEASAALFWLCFVVVLFTGSTKKDGGRWWSIPLAFVPFVVTAIVYFVTPFRVGAGAMLNVRMAPLLALFAVLALDPRPGGWSRVPLLGVFAVGVANAVLATVEMRACVRDEAGDLDVLLQKTRTGARLMALHFREESAHAHFPPWVHAGAYHRASKGGVAAFSFERLHHWPLQYRPGSAPPKKEGTFWIFDPCSFRNESDGPYYDYLLVRGAVDPFRDRPPGPAWQVASTLNDFTLYEKREGEIREAGPTLDQGPCAKK